jgi:LPS-assembly protein
MTSRHRVAFLLLLLLLGLTLRSARAGDSEPAALDIQSLSGEPLDWNLTNGVITAPDVLVKYGDTVMTARRAVIYTNTGDIYADGNVRIQREDMTWIGESGHYNYQTGQIDAWEFRAGQSPMFVEGRDLYGDSDTHTYTATNAYVTADDYAKPLFRIHARRIRIVPGHYFQAWDAILYAGGVPLFYFPYYRRDLGKNADHFNVEPGYRSSFGPFLLNRYDWFYNDNLDGSIHADYRERRGPGVGPDFNFHLGQTDEGVFKYYYTHDQDPGADQVPINLPENRQRAYFSYQASPLTNFYVKSQVNYWSDPLVTHDFFESDYTKDIQPQTFVEFNQVTQNWSLDALAQPRVNDFFETVDRLPDLRLSGFRQQIGDTPLYYESDSSAGWYDHTFSDTNFTQQPFSAGRFDTFHQITLPETFFDWLTVTPRAGGRFTYYTSASGPGAMTTSEDRAVFNTGGEVSTKLSQTWPGFESQLFDMNGARHIIEPSIDYVYVPRPNVLPSRLPQFDYQLTNGLYLLPIDFPDYNAIDSINDQNVIRWGVRNRLQTKRNGQIDDVVDWGLFTDWNLRPDNGESTFSDVFSDLGLRPRTWLRLDSSLRYNIQTSEFDLAQHQITLQPNNTWSWTVGHLFVRSGPVFGQGEDLITSTFYYRMSENWGTRISHSFDATSGTMQQQYYSIYRDLRSWTAALTLRVNDNVGESPDYTVALTFSLKAKPRYTLGEDTVSPPSLLGY